MKFNSIRNEPTIEDAHLLILESEEIISDNDIELEESNIIQLPHQISANESRIRGIHDKKDQLINHLLATNTSEEERKGLEDDEDDELQRKLLNQVIEAQGKETLNIIGTMIYSSLMLQKNRFSN